MKTVNFATSNKNKIYDAQTMCQKAGIIINPVACDVDEIQAEDARRIVQDKAQKVFAQLQQPVIVSDDSWDIPALGGFPGPYMKSINHWFTPDDFLRLMQGVGDRTIILHCHLAYTDGTTIRHFTKDIPGKILFKPHGADSGSASSAIITIDYDEGKTINEVSERPGPEKLRIVQNRPSVWNEFIKWYSQPH